MKLAVEDIDQLGSLNLSILQYYKKKFRYCLLFTRNNFNKKSTVIEFSTSYI